MSCAARLLSNGVFQSEDTENSPHVRSHTQKTSIRTTYKKRQFPTQIREIRLLSASLEEPRLLWSLQTSIHPPELLWRSREIGKSIGFTMLPEALAASALHHAAAFRPVCGREKYLSFPGSRLMPRKHSRAFTGARKVALRLTSFLYGRSYLRNSCSCSTGSLVLVCKQ